MKEKHSSNFLIGLLLGTLVVLIVWYWQKSTRAEDGALDLLDRLKQTQQQVHRLRQETAVQPAEMARIAVPRTAFVEADDLTAVNGIGPVFAERLQQAGVSTIRAVAEMSAARLADILETTESRAANVRAAAQAHE